MTQDELFNRAQSIKLLILDVDGVLTNGQLYYGPQGETFKAFHTHDGQGIKLLHQMGVETAIITGRQSEMVTQRANDLGIRYVYQGQTNKLPALIALCAQLELNSADIAMIGDDLPDLPLLRQAGLAVAVANAVPIIKEVANHVTHLRGGEGAVREICDLILSAQDHWDELLPDLIDNNSDDIEE